MVAVVSAVVVVVVVSVLAVLHVVSVVVDEAQSLRGQVSNIVGNLNLVSGYCLELCDRQ